MTFSSLVLHEFSTLIKPTKENSFLYTGTNYLNKKFTPIIKTSFCLYIRPPLTLRSLVVPCGILWFLINVLIQLAISKKQICVEYFVEDFEVGKSRIKVKKYMV